MSLNNFANFAKSKKNGTASILPKTILPVDPQVSPDEHLEINHADPEGQVDRDALILRVDQIDPDPDQPRKTFDEIEQRAASIKAHTMLMPIVVRPNPESPNRFIIVDGECRWRAHKDILIKDDAAKYSTIRVSLLNISTDPGDIMITQLIANIQRDNLKPLEEARAYAAIKAARGVNNIQLSKLVHKSESQISRILKLLKLSDEDQARIECGELSARDVQREKGTEAATKSSVVAVDKSQSRISKLSISMQTAKSLAELLKHLAHTRELAKIDLGKNSKKDLIAILETRSAEILRVFK